MSYSLKLNGRYPATILQTGYLLMLTKNSGSEPPSCDLHLAFLISPSVDLRRLERTFAKLVDRHDSLRQSFERRGDDWFVNVWDRHRTGLIVEDHGDISDSEFHALLQHHSSLRTELIDGVLFQAIVLRCGSRGDVLFIRCHHAIMDGHSLIVLTEDWLNLLIGIPLLGRGLTHEEFLSEQSNLTPQQKNDNEKYWQQLLLPAFPNPGLGKFGNYGDRPRMVYRTDTIRSMNCSLTSAEFNGLPKAVNDPSQTSFAIVLAAFADTILELSELPGIYVSTAIDRSSHKLRNYVGSAAVSIPVRCEAVRSTPLTEYASSLASQLKQSLVHLPSGAQAYDSDIEFAVNKTGGVLRHFACSVGFTAARAKSSRFSSGIMGASAAPRRIGPLTITRLEIPTVGFNFNGLRLLITPNAERTSFGFSYHNHLFSEDDVEALVSGIQERLHIRFS